MTKLREVVLDIETTGLNPEEGDKIVEIGAVELINHIPSGVNFQEYINPNRQVPADALKVHGLTYDFLKTKPIFSDISNSLLDFLRDDKIIIHNAQFDLGFLNMELLSIGKAAISLEQSIDTLAIARRLFPGKPASLDALSKKFLIDLSKRTYHGALLDCEILAKVYLELIGGRQPDFKLSKERKDIVFVKEARKVSEKFSRRRLQTRVTEDELELHKGLIKKINASDKWSY
tara:strand:- start:219 stop:914 length:696 start_codon:yes stop_codon:yes gene_type:complete